MIRKKVVNKKRPVIIDLTGPDGNAFVLLGYAKSYANQLGLSFDKIRDEMTSGDYENLIQVFDGYTDQPHLGSAMSNGMRGHYFKKHGPGNWTTSEKKIIREVIKSKGYKVGHIDDMETEWDNDRTWPASVTFFEKF